MAMRIAAVPIRKRLNSGRTAAKPKGTSPPNIASMPSMIASIATAVTESGLFLNDSLSVLYQVLIFVH
jgi:hypothetical protein